MQDNISGVSIGIRIDRAFRLANLASEVVDKIAYDKNSPFHKDVYGNTDLLMNGPEVIGRTLYKDEANSISITIDGVVLNLSTNEVKKTLTALKTEYIPYISKNIFDAFDLENINRSGIVFTYQNKDPKKIDRLLNKLTDGKYSQGESFAMRFSHKDVDVKSFIKHPILDYTNAIVTISTDGDKVTSKLDYQFYYEPQIKKIDDIDFDGFFAAAERELNDRFSAWHK